MCQEKRFRTYLYESTAFDYCGVSYTSNDVVIASRVYSGKDVERFYMAERWMVNEKYPSVMFALAKGFENAARECDWEGMSKSAKQILEVLQMQKASIVSREEKGSTYAYKKNISRLLYSLERIVSRRSLDPGKMRKLIRFMLPDYLFEIDASGCDWMKLSENFLKKERILRNLLEVAICIVDAGREMDDRWMMAIPSEESRLKAMMNSRGNGFFRIGRKWALVYCDHGFKVDETNYDKLIPQIDGSVCADPDASSFIVLTSDFGEARRRFFYEGKTIGNFFWGVRGDRIRKSGRRHAKE